MCPGYLKTEIMSRWRFDRRAHLAVTSEKTQHDEERMRDIHVGEQPDMLRRTVRFEQEAPSASGETQDRPGSVLVQKSGYVDDVVQISALDAFYDVDGRKSRNIGEVLEQRDE